MDAAFWFESLGHPTIRMPLRKSVHSLGRASECDIVVRHGTVSRRHAEVRVENGEVKVLDLESRNGTYVSDGRVTEAIVRPNQIIRFGDVGLLLVAAMQDVGGDEDTESRSHQELAAPPTPEAEHLTAAQLRVLDLVKDGLSEKQVASRLALSRHTVHNHIRRIYEAFGAHTRAELMALVFGTGE
ncbi:MAG: FHA domain-containing protein [Gemmataceae bacterium]|nr:FHA domain-containing protein [Gemmataceae bacterium]